MRQEFDVIAFEKHKRVDETNLSECMAENAALLGFYIFQQGTWKNLIDNLKLQLEVKKSQIILDIKAGGVKHTVAEAEAVVSTNEEIIKFEKGILKALEQERCYNAGVEAIKERGRQLQSIGSNRRAEMENVGIRTARNDVSPWNTTTMADIVAGTIKSSHISAGSITPSSMSREELLAKLSGTDSV